MLNPRPPMKQIIKKRLDLNRRRPASEQFGLMGRLSDGVIDVPGKQDTVYVSLQAGGAPVEVVNHRVPKAFKRPVWIGNDPENYPDTLQVLRSAAIFSADESGPDMPDHGDDHTWPAPGTSYIKDEQIYDGLPMPVPGQLSIYVYPGQYYLGTGFKVDRYLTTLDISASVSATGVRYTLLVVDKTGNYVLRDGIERTYVSQLSDADIPLPERGDSVICALRMWSPTMLELRKNQHINDFIDLRLSGARNSTTVLDTHGATHVSTGDDPVPNAVSGGASGLLSGADKATLDLLAAGSTFFDLTSQVDGITAHFDLSAAVVAAMVAVDGVMQTFILDVDGLGFTLSFVPTVGNTVWAWGNIALANALPTWVLEHPDNPPVTPDAIDDEFDGNTLDGAWSIFGTDAPTVTLSDSLLNISCPTATQRIKGIERAAPSGNWTVRMHAYMENYVGNFHGIGFTVRAPTSGYYLYAGIMMHSSWGYMAPWFGAFSTPPTYVSEQNVGSWSLSRELYLQLQWDGTDYILSASMSGKNYVEIGRVAAVWYPGVGDPETLGIAVHNYGPAISASFDWFRRIA